MSINKSVNELIIWRFSDGRTGHDSQSRGLAKALSDITACRIYDLETSSFVSSLAGLLLKRFPAGAGLPDPHILIGAGHGTHLPMLRAGRARGGKTVVLMRPSLPYSWFDYCFIPGHDEPKKADNVFLTQGALNEITRSTSNDPEKGLILIGGTSRHFHWDSDELKEQLQSIVESSNTEWVITDSPRTPADTRSAISGFSNARVLYAPYDSCEKGWLRTQLQIAGVVWVSQDSVSMIYEALSAGGAVGILNLEAKKNTRIVKATRNLIEQSNVTSFNSWKRNSKLAANHKVLQEAARCAELLLTNLERDWALHK